MFKTATIDRVINQYYDDEMNDLELLNFEARVALSSIVQDYRNEQCFDFYKISNSMQAIKRRLERKSELLVDVFFENYEKKKSIRQFLCHFLSKFL